MCIMYTVGLNRFIFRGRKNILHTALCNVRNCGTEHENPQKVKKPVLSTCQIYIALTFSLRSSYFSLHAEIH